MYDFNYLLIYGPAIRTVEYGGIMAADVSDAYYDYSQARRKANIEKVFSLLRGKRTTPVPFEKVKALLGGRPESYRGIRTVEVANIIGSESRYSDFTRSFAPATDITKRRWMSVDDAVHKGITLPPVVLYEVGGVYFVRDGNHRVSVAKNRGVVFMDAEVTSLDADISFRPDMDLREITEAIIAYEERRFYEATGLKDARPNANVRFSAIARYDLLVGRIEAHKVGLEERKGTSCSFQEAALFWYDNEYEPITRYIWDEKILDSFHGRTAGDLYVWMSEYAEEIEERFKACILPEDAVSDLKEKYGGAPLKRAVSALKKLFGFGKRKITRSR